MTQFFFFGCWNRDNCGGKDYRKGLFDTLMPIASSFDFGVIAGDNVYPHERKYYMNTLEYGFQLLEDLKQRTALKTMYATIGNHDVNRVSVLEYQMKSQSITMPRNMYMVQVSAFLRIIFLDTNLFTHKHPILYKDMKNLPENVKSFFDVHNENEVLEELDAILQQSPTYKGWTIVVGHEPIVSIKPKQNNNIAGIKMNSWIPYERILNKLASIPKTVYMCADVHTFQGWNIYTDTGILPMVVAGTGGGDPDDNLSIGGTYSKDSKKLELIASEYPYGYCKVNCTSEKLEITYVPLKNCTISNTNVKLQYKNKKLYRSLTSKSNKNITVNMHKCIAPPTEAFQCVFDPLNEMKGGKR